MGTKEPAERVVEIRTFESVEQLGKFLERNNATLHVSCQYGRYDVTLTYHRLKSYKEEGWTSVRRSEDVVVSTNNEHFAAAVQAALEQPVPKELP